MNLPLVTVIGLIVAVVGVLMTVIGIDTTSWQTGTSTGTSRRSNFSTGLFKNCTTSDKRSQCLTIASSNQSGKVPAWLMGTRALVIIGFLLGVACVVALTTYIIKRDLKPLHSLGIAFAFAAGVCVLIGTIIYADNKTPSVVRETTVDLGGSFALTVGGCVTFVIAGVILVVDILRGPARTR